MKCAARLGSTLPLSPDGLKFLRLFLRTSFESVLTMSLDRKTSLEIRRVLDRFISYRSEGDLRTRRVLAQLGLG